ncbi:glycosyltransferase [Lentisphaerota bacterium WC36G]|nr:glycosyltransferase [Lentisphaerae bacterium WC36]
MEENVLGIVLNSYPRLSRPYIANEMELLERMGYSLKIFPLKHSGENLYNMVVKRIKSQIVYLDELNDSESVLVAKQLVNNPKRFLQAKKIYKELLNCSVDKELLDDCFAKAVLLARQLRKDKRIKHLHSHTILGAGTTMLFTSVLSGLGYSMSLHSDKILDMNSQLTHIITDRAKFILTTSKKCMEVLQDLQIKAKLYNLYHGIDLNMFSFREFEPKSENKPFNIITVSSYITRDSLRNVVEALLIMKRMKIDFNFCLMGQSENPIDIGNFLEEYGIKNQTRWLGMQRHFIVAKELLNSDVFLATSRRKNSGIPDTIAEAMACGTAIVAPKIEAIEEIIEDGETGVIVADYHPEEMARKTIELLKDSQLRESLGMKARLKVEALCDNRQIVGSIVKIFEENGVTI